MKKHISHLFLWILSILPIMAQKMNVQVSTTKPAVGVPFEITFHMNAIPQDFTPPSFKDFEIISGPNQSQNIQFINGSLSQSFSISYVLIPKKEGPVVINAAKAIVNGQTIYSSPITIDVQKGNSNYSAQSQQRTTAPQEASTNVSKEDIFVRTSINKKQCYIGEQITLTQKIYTRVELRGIQNVKFPHLEGFWSKNQENNRNIQLHIENIDGINYYVGEISTQYLFPQKSGKLTISPIEIECVVRKRSSRAPRDIWEQFFGVNAFEDHVVTLKSQPISVEVWDLPTTNKQAHFSGAVGTNFNFKTEINKTKIPANEALQLKITISGAGNIPLVDAPKINFPQEFETYDPKITENISTANGVSGTKTFEYLIIPRQEGHYKLSDIQFSYFNPSTKNYVTIPSPEILIEVTPSTNANNNAAQVYQQFKQEIKSEDNDIHFIRPYPFTLFKKHETFFNSTTHIALTLLPYLAMVAVFGFYQYQKIQRSDWASFQQKRAQKIAFKHLQLAEKTLKTGNTAEFYTAIIQALENYLTSKFKLQKSELSRDKIKEIFKTYNISDELQKRYFDLMDTCELAKYAPIASQQSLENIHSSTQQLITDFERTIKLS